MDRAAKTTSSYELCSLSRTSSLRDCMSSFSAGVAENAHTILGGCLLVLRGRFAVGIEPETVVGRQVMGG